MTLYTSRGDVNEISLDAVYECIFEVKEDGLDVRV